MKSKKNRKRVKVLLFYMKNKSGPQSLVIDFKASGNLIKRNIKIKIISFSGSSRDEAKDS